MSHLLGSGYHYIIVVASEHRIPKRPKGLADLPLHPVPIQRGSPRFESDSQSEITQVVLDAKDGALADANDLVLTEKSPVLRRTVEPIAISKS
jgi:hypothetical protein